MDEQPSAPVENPAPQPNPAPSEPPAAPPAPAAPAQDLPSVPDTWPGAFGAYKFSKAAVKVNLGVLVILWVLNFVVSGLLEWKLKDIGQLGSIILGSLASAAIVLVYLAGIRRQKLSLGEALSKALPLWLKMIGLTLLVALSLMVSLVLLIIPFFFVVPRLSLVNYFLVDKNMGVIEAYKASWAATKGNALKVWGIILASVAMALPIITIIGIPVAIYLLVMYSAAFAVFYEFLNKNQPAAVPTPQVEAPAAPPAALVV